MQVERRRILFVVNHPDWFFSHRLPIALNLLEKGHEVHLASAAGDDTPFKSNGIQFHALKLSRGGLNPFKELLVFIQILQILTTLKPDIVHLITIKPVLYGGIAARLAGVHNIVVAIAGLGAIFISNSLKSKLIRIVIASLFKVSLGGQETVAIFQNKADRDLVLKLSGFDKKRAVLIRGSGVDISKYRYQPEPTGRVIVSMASRLLTDKGVVEFIKASEILADKGYGAEFWLIGESDPENPASISKKKAMSLIKGGYCKLLGYRDDIADLFLASNIIVLPSYREGLPKVLVEAAACGRAVVTTDVPGCRDAIEPDKTGLLVPVKDELALANAIKRLIDDVELRKRFGVAGRALAEREFGISKIVDAHMGVYKMLIQM